MRGSIWTPTIATLAATVTLGFAGAGCETARENPRTTGALVGAGTGALAGSAIAGKGAKTEGAAIGAAAGAGAGWLGGNEGGKKDNSERESARRARDPSYSEYR